MKPEQLSSALQLQDSAVQQPLVKQESATVWPH